MRKKTAAARIILLVLVLVMAAAMAVFADDTEEGKAAAEPAVNQSEEEISDGDVSGITDTEEPEAVAPEAAEPEGSAQEESEPAPEEAAPEISDGEEQTDGTAETPASEVQQTAETQSADRSDEVSGQEAPSSGTKKDSDTVIRDRSRQSAKAAGEKKTEPSETTEEPEEPEEVVHVHDYGKWVVVRKPTYFKKGLKQRTCSCGEVQTKRIKKLKGKKKWVKDNGKRYYFNRKGKLTKGWHKVRTYRSKIIKWCFFDKKGRFRKCVSRDSRNRFVKAGRYTFFFGDKKRPVGEGWHTVNNHFYYMNKKGAVKHGKFKAKDGRVYKSDKKSGIVSIFEYYRYKYGSYVLIDLSDQMLWYYKNYRHRMTADVVTGTRGVHDTPTGVYQVNSKARNITLTGPTWSVPVAYWMAFIGSSHGMHDASWRSAGEFSNHSTYYSNGSHGCVNMRYNNAASLYNMITVGTPVIVQW